MTIFRERRLEFSAHLFFTFYYQTMDNSFDMMLNHLTEENIKYIHMDAEAFDGPEDYDLLVEELSRLSEEDTRIEWVGGDYDTNSVEFKLDGTTHEFVLPIRSDYMQMELLDYINTELSNLNKQKSFFNLETGDQSMILVYGDQTMNDEFKSKKWLMGQWYSEFLYGDNEKTED